MTTPLYAVHRRNKISQLDGLPKGCWIEFDVEAIQGEVCLTHDVVAGGAPTPDKLLPFFEKALAVGVAGFIIDCKREAIEKMITPILNQLGIKDYFYLNEMEVQADIFMEQDPAHQSGIRIWKYRRAPDVIRYAADRKAANLAYPKWIWLDCWELGLLRDIHKALLPMTGDEAHQLQDLGVKICLCSPELYVHKYDTAYTDAEMEAFYNGIRAYKKQLAAEGIAPDLICSKFPQVWQEP